MKLAALRKTRGEVILTSLLVDLLEGDLCRPGSSGPYNSSQSSVTSRSTPLRNLLDAKMVSLKEGVVSTAEPDHMLALRRMSLWTAV